MRKYLQKNYLLSGSTFGEEDLVEGDFIMNKKRHMDKLGLLRAHSYTILRIEDIGGVGEPSYLINLRNPWSQPISSSKILWNERSEMWTSKLKILLQPEFNETNFWLT